MKRYIKASLNSELWKIDTSSINGGNRTGLTQKLRSLLEAIPVGRYILAIGNRGYNTGYYKVDAENIRWADDKELHKISGYWDTDTSYIVLPAAFKPWKFGRIDHDDDNVVVYEIFNTENQLYSGLEDYEPMKLEDWQYCRSLGMYYLIDYADHKIYVKWLVGN